MHGFQNPNIIDHPIEDDGRFPSSRNRRHSAKPEPLYGVSALAGECRTIAQGVGSVILGMAALYLVIFAYGAVA